MCDCLQPFSLNKLFALMMPYASGSVELVEWSEGVDVGS
jgi:hypothetical protein